MKTIDYYAVHGERDTTEGRAGTFLVAAFSTRAAAVEFCEKHGSYWSVFGSPMNPDTYLKQESIAVYDSVEEACEDLKIETPNIKAAKKAALAKLTDRERKLLGL